MEGNRHPEINDLKRIRCLSQLDDGQLARLARKLPLMFAETDECMIELGCTENYSLYLVNGSLEAITHDDQRFSFDSDSGDDLYPIAQLRPSLFRVVATEPTRYIRIYTNQLTEFAQRPEDDDLGEIEVVEIEQSEEENELTIQLFKDLISGNLSLPSLPNVAQRIQQAFANDAVNAESICTTIQSDPAIIAKLGMGDLDV